jgi:hypothetical protein
MLTLVGGAALIAAALMPWATFVLGDRKVGTRGAGAIGKSTAGLAVLVLLDALIRKRRPGKRFAPVSSLLALLVAALACLDGLIVLAGEGMVVNDPLANPGPGQCMTIIGALLVLLGGLSADGKEPNSVALGSGSGSSSHHSRTTNQSHEPNSPD